MHTVIFVYLPCDQSPREGESACCVVVLWSRVNPSSSDLHHMPSFLQHTLATSDRSLPYIWWFLNHKEDTWKEGTSTFPTRGRRASSGLIETTEETACENWRNRKSQRKKKKTCKNLKREKLKPRRRHHEKQLMKITGSGQNEWWEMTRGDSEEDIGCVCLATAGREAPGAC